MLFSPEMLVPSGPPPQAVLDKRHLWKVLSLILSVTFVLRMLAMDVAGAILAGLMLCLASLVTREGMSELSKYALLYGTLCVLCFFFDIIPLLVSLGGRTETLIEPGPTVASRGKTETTIEIVTHKHPFISWPLGVAYNCLSISMITSPLGMLLGAYLGLSAHNEFMSSIPDDEDEDFGFRGGLLGQANPMPRGPVLGGLPRGGGGAGAGNNIGAAAAAPQSYGADSSGSRAAASQRRGPSFERFAGEGHKLSDAPVGPSSA